MPWANGALCTPAPLDDAPLVEEDEENEGEVETVEPGTYQQVCKKMTFSGKGWGTNS